MYFLYVCTWWKKGKTAPKKNAILLDPLIPSGQFAAFKVPTGWKLKSGKVMSTALGVKGRYFIRRFSPYLRLKFYILKGLVSYVQASIKQREAFMPSYTPRLLFEFPTFFSIAAFIQPNPKKHLGLHTLLAQLASSLWSNVWKVLSGPKRVLFGATWHFNNLIRSDPFSSRIRRPNFDWP